MSEVGPRFVRRLDRGVHLADTPLRVRVRSFLFTPDRRRQHQVRELARRRRMKPVLHDEELDGLERLFEHTQIGKRDDRIRRDDPERANAPIERSLDDVRVGKTPRGRQPIHRKVPQGGQLLAVGSALELPVAGHRRGKSCFAGAHRVALSRDRERRRPGAADVAGDEREVVDRVDRFGSLGTVVDAHRPADERGAGVAVQGRGAVDQFDRQPGDLRRRWRACSRGPTRAARRSPSCERRCTRGRSDRSRSGCG